MRISSRVCYAITALIDLAQQEQASFVSLQSIVQRQQIPLTYLEHLFPRLRRDGLVAAARGPGGGYALARSAAQISVADIVHAVDQTGADKHEPAMAPERGLTPEAASAHALWLRADAQIQSILQGTSLQMLLDDELLAGVREKSARPAPRSPVLPSGNEAARQALPSRAAASIFDLADALA